MGHIKKISLIFSLLILFAIGLSALPGELFTISGEWEVQVTEEALGFFQSRMTEEGLDKDGFINQHLQEWVREEYETSLDEWFESSVGNIADNPIRTKKIIEVCTNMEITDLTHSIQNVCTNQTVQTPVEDYVDELCEPTLILLDIDDEEQVQVVIDKLLLKWNELTIKSKEYFKDCAINQVV